MSEDRVHPVGEVATQLGISAETLRYYERRGVLPPPSYDVAGHRVYGDDEVHLIEVLIHLRNTGMPLATIAEFTRQNARDPDGVPERLALLQQHRGRVVAQLEQLNRSLAAIDQKISDYSSRARGQQ